MCELSTALFTLAPCVEGRLEASCARFWWPNVVVNQLIGELMYWYVTGPVTKPPPLLTVWVNSSFSVTDLTQYASRRLVVVQGFRHLFIRVYSAVARRRDGATSFLVQVPNCVREGLVIFPGMYTTSV